MLLDLHWYSTQKKPEIIIFQLNTIVMYALSRRVLLKFEQYKQKLLTGFYDSWFNTKTHQIKFDSTKHSKFEILRFYHLWLQCTLHKSYGLDNFLIKLIFWYSYLWWNSCYLVKINQTRKSTIVNNRWNPELGILLGTELCGAGAKHIASPNPTTHILMSF